MNITIASSLFFFAAVTYLFFGGIRYKKSEEALPLLTWVGLILVLVTCFHVAVAGIIQLIHIPVNIVTMGIADLLAGTFFWYQSYRRKEKQKYKMEWIDLIFGGTLLLVIAVVFFVRFHGSELILTFTTIDPAAHLKAAMDVVNNQYVQNMYYSALENGLLIELLGPLFKEDYYYKIFVLSEIYHLALAGLMFYGAIRHLMKDRFTRICGYLLSVLYLIGYPANSMTYGFVYLGLGVTVVCAILTFTNSYLNGEQKDKKLPVVMLSLLCYGIFECYVLFMPITYFAVITGIFVRAFRKKQLVSKHTVVTCLGVFLLPCIFGFFYTYAGIFTEAGITVSSQLTAEGACYRDLYSNFLFFLPLALYGIWQSLKHKKNDGMNYLFLYGIVFVGGLFLMGMMGKVSSYYYYKNYNLLWLLVFYMAAAGAAALDIRSRQFLVCYGATGALVMGLYLGNIEDRIATRAPMFDIQNKSRAFNDLLSFNKENFKNDGYSKEKLELYHYVYDQLLSKGEELVPIVCYWEDDFWYQGITDQRLKGYDYNAADNENNLAQMKKDGNYVLVLTDNTMYENSRDYYDSLEKLYENEIGFVAVIK